MITPFICIGFETLRAFHWPVFDSYNNIQVFPEEKFKSSKVSYAGRCSSLCYIQWWKYKCQTLSEWFSKYDRSIGYKVKNIHANVHISKKKNICVIPLEENKKHIKFVILIQWWKHFCVFLFGQGLNGNIVKYKVFDGIAQQ